MNIDYLTQLLQNKLTILNGARIQAFNSGDLAQINLIDTETLQIQDTLIKLGLLSGISVAAQSTGMSEAEIVTKGIENALLIAQAKMDASMAPPIVDPVPPVPPVPEVPPEDEPENDGDDKKEVPPPPMPEAPPIPPKIETLDAPILMEDEETKKILQLKEDIEKAKKAKEAKEIKNEISLAKRRRRSV